MPRHIGIVACSFEGAALCYRTICEEGERRMGEHDHPQVSLHNHSLAESMRCIDRGDWQGVGELMLSSARKLAAAGADVLVCPDNTIHQAWPYVEPHAPLPWLHIADVVADEAKKRGYRRIGLTGTKYLVASNVYPQDYVRPTDEEREEINRIIFEELVHGVFKRESLAYFQGVIERFKRQGCDAVALCCTEIPLLVNDSVSPLPTLDSTRLLARAAVEWAMSH